VDDLLVRGSDDCPNEAFAPQSFEACWSTQPSDCHGHASADSPEECLNAVRRDIGVANFWTRQPAPQRRTAGVGSFAFKFKAVTSSEVAALGRGLHHSHHNETVRVSLWAVEGKMVLARIAVGPSSPVRDGYAYEPLPTPVHLLAGKQYILSQECTPFCRAARQAVLRSRLALDMHASEQVGARMFDPISNSRFRSKPVSIVEGRQAWDFVGAGDEYTQLNPPSEEYTLCALVFWRQSGKPPQLRPSQRY
jgi:hypothetical protein